MNLRTKSLMPFGGIYYPVDLFGYVSHGLPGIEIVGLGKYGRNLKEKFIYLTREKNLKVPKRRFVLCVEGELEGKKFNNEEYRYLELPLLLMLWSLSGHLPFKNFDDCFTSGKISIDGKWELLNLNSKLLEQLPDLLDVKEIDDLKIITSEANNVGENFYHISIEEIMNLVNSHSVTN